MTPGTRLGLEKFLASRWLEGTAPDCVCHMVDVGIGLLKAGEDPGCPNCVLEGFADWAVKNGTPEEKAAAGVFLREWEADMSAQAMAAAREMT